MLIWHQVEKQDEKPATSEVVSTPKETSERVQRADSSRQNQPVDVWKNWVDKRTEAMLQYLQNNPESQGLFSKTLLMRTCLLNCGNPFYQKISHLPKCCSELPIPRHRLTSVLTSFSELRGSSVENSSVEDYNSYEGPQEVEALLEKFGNRAANPMLDKKYPQKEWIQRALAQGYTIDSWEDYAGFVTARRNLIGLESAPEVWKTPGD